ncbi:response regulator [Lentisalinibacter orientalis]|uniref:response regulator n=1 Tax=Lentisalinibacter orientalis TaxID=2992241 RepID=UPI00386C4086
MERSHRIMVVDDDPDVRGMLQDFLELHHFEVRMARSADEARELLAGFAPDLILLDIGLPGEDGLSLARYVREHHDVAIIIVSGADDTLDRIIGLEVGADDYLTKPFDTRELLARVKSVLRRYRRSADTAAAAGESAGRAAAAGELIPVGRYRLDCTAEVLLDEAGEEVALTRMEYELLHVLAERPNRPLSRDRILNLTQNRDWDPYDRSVDIRVARLRQKVEEDPANPRLIRTVRGVGYKFVPAS